MQEFLIAHGLHFLVGAFLVWFLWRAVTMYLSAEGDPDAWEQEGAQEEAGGYREGAEPAAADTGGFGRNFLSTHGDDNR